ncbi:MAG TPA: hypothetical protein VNS58_09365 [Puia sp.]|nr:hypothetical protein [Puia sp.]
MNKITGRPPKAIRQEKNIGFFVTHQQYFIIQQKALKAGVNLSDYLRQTAVSGQVMTRWTADEREIFKRLVGMSNELNELVELARQQGTLSAMLYFEQSRDKIDWIIKQLDHDQ